jgi:hypothetical protein
MTSIELPSSMDLLQGASNFEQTIQSSNTARFFPSGSTSFSDSQRNISIRLSSSDYIRPQTATLLFTLQLSNAGQIPEDMFAVQCLGTVTLECGGRVCESVQNCGLSLYPLIVHSTPASVYRSTLSVSGAYKYKPSYSHFLQFAEKGKTVGFGQSTNSGSAPRYGLPAVETWPFATADGTSGANAVQFYNSKPVTMNTVGDVKNYLDNITDYMLSGHQVSFCKPDSDVNAASVTAFGLDYGPALTVYTDGSQTTSTSFAVCGNNFTNSQCVGSLVSSNSMPIHGQPNAVFKSTQFTEASATIPGITYASEYGNLGLGHPIEAEGTNTRTYALYLKDVLGIFNSHRLFPLRNAGSMVLNIQLRPYNEMFIHTLPSNAGSWLPENSPGDVVSAANGHKDMADILANNQLPYTISNVRITVDTVRPADSFVQRVDDLCAGPEGLSIVYTTRETSVTPVNYSTNVQITSTRAYSFLKCIYTHFIESLTSQSVYLVKSDRSLGSRFIRSNTTIGSTTYPLINIESPSEAFTEVKKACLKPNSIGEYPEDSVIDLQIYTGKRNVLGTSDKFSCAGLFPSLKLVKESSTILKLKQSFQCHTQAPSCFLMAQNVDRVLQSGVTYSGLSTRTSGFSITTSVDFQPFTTTANLAEEKGYHIMNPAYIDAHLGNSSFRAIQVFEFDALLRLANSSVEVRN